MKVDGGHIRLSRRPDGAFSVAVMQRQPWGAPPRGRTVGTIKALPSGGWSWAAWGGGSGTAIGRKSALKELLASA